jgi:hypothetical protein
VFQEHSGDAVGVSSNALDHEGRRQGADGHRLVIAVAVFPKQNVDRATVIGPLGAIDAGAAL